MSKQNINRRKALQIIGATAGIAVAGGTKESIAKPTEKPAFIYCLNMATIRGHNLGFIKELETASAAGFRAVEIWMDSLQAYLRTGGTITDAKKRLDDLGLKVEDCIGFAKWIVDDKPTRKKAIEQLKMEMGLLAQIGCKRMAAPAMGATDGVSISLDTVAERYRAILDLSDESGVVPQLEMWGFLKILSNVSDVLYVAMQSGHPSARVLLDIFHLYRGNTSLDTLPLMSPSAVDILHMNDYPAGISHEVITDADRIYPGDGIAPIKRILNTLRRHDQPLVLSAELFNKKYYTQDALTVAKTALVKMKWVTERI
ncbi:MAG TPA: sugar phosphate isomerase/epimerase family protein [Mucilaginibacter sp.]|jgi:2-keto-myo-inositol isomerase|nr:sugar phosphate isomerase/epimerase family protein [Mucilaginibacter sp.]